MSTGRQISVVQSVPQTTPSRQRGTTAEALLEMMPALRVYARNLMRGSDEVDDLVQETLMKALANVSSFERGTNLRAWLFTIMRNSFLTRVTKSNRERVGSMDCVSGTVLCFPKHDAHMAGNKVMAAIESLPDPFREAVVLVFLVGESYHDVAKICECSIGTVKSRISRGRHLVMNDLGAQAVDDLIAPYY